MVSHPAGKVHSFDSYSYSEAKFCNCNMEIRDISILDDFSQVVALLTKMWLYVYLRAKASAGS